MSSVLLGMVANLCGWSPPSLMPRGRCDPAGMTRGQVKSSQLESSQAKPTQAKAGDPRGIHVPRGQYLKPSTTCLIERPDSRTVLRSTVIQNEAPHPQ